MLSSHISLTGAEKEKGKIRFDNCDTPLCFVEESIYDIDRLQIVTHGVDETDGADNWGWRRSVTDLVRRARKLIDEKSKM